MSSEEFFKLLKSWAGLSLFEEIVYFFVFSGIIVYFFVFSGIWIALFPTLLTHFSSHLPIFTATGLTILALFSTCAYAIKNSSRHNMHNANANFYFYVKDHKIEDVKDHKIEDVKIWFKELALWRDLYIRHIAVTTNWFYSFSAIGFAFLFSILFDINKSYFYLGPIVIYWGLIVIIILLWFSIWKFFKGFGCVSLDADAFDEKKSLITHLLKGFLDYECKTRTHYKDEFYEFLKELRDDIKKDRELLLKKRKKTEAKECLTQVKYLNKLLKEKAKQDKDCGK